MRRHHPHHEDGFESRPDFAGQRPGFGGPNFGGARFSGSDEESGSGFGGRGRGRGGRGGAGFGPGAAFGPGFGPGFGGPGFGGPGFGGRGRGGPGFGGPGGPGGPRGPRGRRSKGNVRAAVLALLAEEPRHGYALITEISERSEGLWRPSPGSVYPMLQQLQDEGLITVEESAGRRVFSITETGRAWVTEHESELADLWTPLEEGPMQARRQIHQQLQAFGTAVHEVFRAGDQAQIDQALAVIDDARRSLYRILAGDAPTGTPAATDVRPETTPPDDSTPDS